MNVYSSARATFMLVGSAAEEDSLPGGVVDLPHVYNVVLPVWW